MFAHLFLSLDAILTRKLGIFSFVRKLYSVSTERRNHDLYLRRSIVIGRSQNLHDCRINLSAIGVTVSVEFHLKGRTLLFVSSLYPRNPEISILFVCFCLSFSRTFPFSSSFFFYRYSLSFRSRFRIDRITLRTFPCNCICRETLFFPRDYFRAVLKFGYILKHLFFFFFFELHLFYELSHKRGGEEDTKRLERMICLKIFYLCLFLRIR